MNLWMKRGVTIDGHEITPADLNLLNATHSVENAEFLFYTEDPEVDANEEERVEFRTGLVVTRLQILGAIHTYYSIPLTKVGTRPLRRGGEG